MAASPQAACVGEAPAACNPWFSSEGVDFPLTSVWKPALDSPFVLDAHLWELHRDAHAPSATLPILLWSSFLKNGGRIVIGLAAGLLCWALARRWATVRPPTPMDR